MEDMPDRAVAPVLIAMQKDIQPQEHVLDQELCTLGRRSCHILVPGQQVSRLHATITRSGLRFLLSDQRSVNGTYVNGQRIQAPHVLMGNDQIGLGSGGANLRFVDPDRTQPSGLALRYDDRAKVFWLGESPVDLTPSQFRLLYHLYQHAGEVCSRESCAQAIWGRDYLAGTDAGAFDQTITSLRNALRAVDPQANPVQNRRGMGYMLVL